MNKLIKRMKRMKQQRQQRNNNLVINGIHVPRDRKQWTDDLEREIIAARARYW